MKTATLMKPKGLLVGLMILLCLAAYAGRFPVADWHSQTNLLQKELDRLHSVARSGGWGTIQAKQKFYQKGQSAPAIVQIKHRLHRSGDLEMEDATPLFTDELVTAVKLVQQRFGHTANGVVDAALLKQLNVPVEKRIRQLEANLARLQQLPNHRSGTWLIANIPEFKLYVMENGRTAFDMNIVVGSLDNKTVLFNDEMQYLVFSPYWNVPSSIVRGEILPAVRRNRGYLSANGYERIGTDENGLPKIRQKPGANNSLGQVKFVFPNSHNIYFHDTPAKSLFNLRKRAFSHGCIRLAEPARLAEYLLRNTEWSPDKIQRAMASGRETRVDLEGPVPVSITYFTAWVDEAGQLNFRDDIYGMDR